MVGVTDSPREVVVIDLQAACVDLADAEAAQRADDSAHARERVARCRDRIDALLDMWNAAAR